MHVSIDCPPPVDRHDPSVLDAQDARPYLDDVTDEGWDAPRRNVVTSEPIQLPGDGPNVTGICRFERYWFGWGWDGRPHHEVVDWPLLRAINDDYRRASSGSPSPDEAAIAENVRKRLVHAAEHYRSIEALAHAETPLAGGEVDRSDGFFRLDQRTYFRSDGELVYSGVRGGWRNPRADGPRHNGDRMPGPWPGEDRIAARLDAQRQLEKLRDRLGPLVRPVEDAVVGGLTLEQVGRREGIFHNKASASAAGKALVFRGLHEIASTLN